jgi:ribonuclease PH
MQALRGAVLTETFPKSFVDGYVLVLQADAAELPAAVMAASLALAHAGVACRDLVSACTVVRARVVRVCAICSHPGVDG